MNGREFQDDTQAFFNIIIFYILFTIPNYLVKINEDNFDELKEKYPIQCYKCGMQVGHEKIDDDCSQCGFSTNESLVQWILERQDMKG